MKLTVVLFVLFQAVKWSVLAAGALIFLLILLTAAALVVRTLTRGVK